MNSRPGGNTSKIRSPGRAESCRCAAMLRALRSREAKVTVSPAPSPASRNVKTASSGARPGCDARKAKRSTRVECSEREDNEYAGMNPSAQTESERSCKETCPGPEGCHSDGRFTNTKVELEGNISPSTLSAVPPSLPGRPGSRKFKGVMSVHTSLIWARHFPCFPLHPPSANPEKGLRLG